MGYVVTTTSAVVYKVRFERAEGETDRFGWADAAIRAWPRGGSISIQSDYDSYAYTWTSIGPRAFTDFLCGLDFDYFMGKASPGYMQFDYEKTVAGIRRAIVERRRDRFCRIEKEFARECWDDLGLYGGDDGRFSGDLFASEILRSNALSRFFDGDYADIIRNSPSPQALGFWREIWPHLVSAWREETKCVA